MAVETKAATHTPGPWAVVVSPHQREFTHWIQRPRSEALDRETVAAVLNVNESDANARLIAAAPDLLEAARALLAIYDKELGGLGLPGVREARAAIAKAEGR